MYWTVERLGIYPYLVINCFIFLHLLLKKNRRMLSLIFDFHWSHHCWILAYSFVEIMIPHKWIMVRYNWRTFVTIGYLSLIERGWDQVLVSVVVMLMMISLIWTLTKYWRGAGGSISEVLLIRQRLTHPPISGCSISVVIKRLFDGKSDGCFKLKKKNHLVWLSDSVKKKSDNLILREIKGKNSEGKRFIADFIRTVWTSVMQMD